MPDAYQKILNKF